MASYTFHLSGKYTFEKLFIFKLILLLVHGQVGKEYHNHKLL